MADARSEHRYNRLTWADDAIGLQKLVIPPTGSTEPHGRHPPLDVDIFLCETVCHEVGRRAADRVLLPPSVAYGPNLHPMHPIEPEVFIAFEAVRESQVVAHADEFETWLYLHLAPERVQMDKAAKGDDRMGEFVSSDSTSRYLRFSDDWGRTVASAEKGRVLFEAAVAGRVCAADQIRAWPIAARSDPHPRPVQRGICC